MGKLEDKIALNFGIHQPHEPGAHSPTETSHTLSGFDENHPNLIS